MAKQPIQTCTIPTAQSDRTDHHGHGKARRQQQGVLVPIGERSICLTNSQFASLFGKRRAMPKRLGCGAFACVYDAPEKGKVVKLTGDPSDVWSMRKAQGTNAVPTLYRTFQLAPAWREQYAMVLEKVTPLTATPEGVKLIGPWTCTRYKMRRALGTAPRAQLIDTCCDDFLQSRTLQRKCARDIHGILQAKTALLERDIDVDDDHAGNIGHDRKGNWKIIDTGMTARGSLRLPELQGAHR